MPQWQGPHMQTTAYEPELNVDATDSSVNWNAGSSDWRAHPRAADAGAMLRELRLIDPRTSFTAGGGHRINDVLESIVGANSYRAKAVWGYRIH